MTTVWVDIPDDWLQPDSPLTSPLMFALRDNQKAFAEGDPSAPTISSALFNIGGGSYDGLGDGATFLDGASQLKPGHYDFSALHWMAGSKTLPDCTIIRSQGAVTLDTGLAVTVSTREASGRNVERLFSAIVGNDGQQDSLGASNYGSGGSLGDGVMIGDQSPPYGPPFGPGGHGLLQTPLTANRFWASKKPIVGGNSDGGSALGGGSLVLLVDGTVSIGAAISANGGIGLGGGGGGSIIIISLGGVTYLSGASFSAKGGNGSGGGGGGGYIGLVAPSFSGSRTIDVTGGVQTGYPFTNPGAAGFSEEVTMTAGQIKQMLWGR